MRSGHCLSQASVTDTSLATQVTPASSCQAVFAGTELASTHMQRSVMLPEQALMMIARAWKGLRRQAGRSHGSRCLT